jgi:hypothetical protein
MRSSVVRLRSANFFDGFPAHSLICRAFLLAPVIGGLPFEDRTQLTQFVGNLFKEL